MATEENKAIIQRLWEEVVNKGNLDIADELFATSYVYHGPGGREIKGPEGFKQFIALRRIAFPDFHVAVEDLIAEGDRVVSRWTAAGRHKGDLMGIAPTDRQGTMTGITITRVVGGRVVEDWENLDQLGMLRQLGAIPPLEKGFFAMLWWLAGRLWRGYTARRMRSKPMPIQ